MARALKVLESYGNRQTKLWKVLSKYDRLPDHFHNLQTTLQTEFNLLKKATSKNIKNLHEAVNFQQTCTMSLCSHINSIYSKLAQLDRQIQTHCLYSHSQSDTVMICCSSFRYLPTIGYSILDENLPLTFSSVNWCKIDVFTLNIIPLHHKKSQTINNNKNTK